jgi:uncharacterized membrane protein YsdA (DUF1294 family)/cold shock CspA family protein
MRYQGRLTTWHDDKGYGFITPNGGGPRVFVHRNDVGSGRRPRGDEIVTYELTVDEKNRRNARKVQYVAASRGRGLPAVGAIGAPLLAFVFFAFLVGAVIGGRMPWAVPAWYAVLSAVTFAIYRSDKNAAARRNWRTPEKRLHLLSLAGGWPGALVAQRWLRHKSRKASFLATFFATVVLNLAALGWLHSTGGVQVRQLLGLAAVTHLG